MSNTLETAMKFFDACETGKGWEACKSYCHSGSTFSAQSGAIADIDNIEGYTEWMKGLLTPIPDGSYELKSFSEDKDRQTVTAFAVFHGTQTGPGGPGEPTGKTIEADYVYAIQFEGDLIKHMTKIWNDTISLQQLGWA